MDERDVREWMDANLARKALEFGLADWEIKWAEEDVEGGSASVEAKPEYRFAKINIDVRDQKSAADLERTVEHELLHAVSSNVYDTAWTLIQQCSASDAEKAILCKALVSAVERDCTQMERLVSGLRGKP